MNEENVKDNVVLPFLHSLGFDKANLTFEDAFSVKWGHNDETVNKKKNASRPRSDVLVTENGKPLFVIETKKDESDLTEDDKWQAISYARLMIPSFCPYAVLTNGTETKIFDAFTGEEITDIGQSSYVKAGYKLQLDYDMQSEAISKLITLNYENLHTLCKYQTDETLNRLITSKKDELKNYIDEVFVTRKSLGNEFEQFLDDENKICFLINGKSGSGKTNLMCNLAQTYSSRFPVLFVSASQLSSNLDIFIANEFNWNFSTHKYPEQYIKQLHPILEKHDTKLLLFVDALDEWAIENPEIKLSEFLKQIPGKRIKIILTCKKTRSVGFLRNKAIPLPLSELVFQIDKQPLPSLNIDEFDNQELWEVKDKAKKYFSFSNDIPTDTLEKCRNPALLRAVCETYQGKKVPDSLNSIEIWQKFLEIKLEKANGKRSQVLEHLKKISEKMFDEHCDEIFESDIDNIDHHANDFCKDSGILIEKKDEHGRSIISFEFEGLRNFIITHHFARLDTLELNELEEFAKSHISTLCGKEVIQWYDMNAKQEQHKALSKAIAIEDKNRAEQFIEKLMDYTTTTFPSIWKFSQYPEKTLGLLILYDEETNHVVRHAYRKISQNEDKVVWLEKKDWTPFSEKKEIEIVKKYNSGFFGFNSNDFTVQPPESFAFETALSFINNKIKERRLDETKNIGIAIEKFFAIIQKSGIILGISDYEENYLENHFPLDLTKIKEYLKHYFDRDDSEQGYYGGIVLQSGYRRYVISYRELDRLLDTIISKNKILETTLLPQPDIPEYPGWLHINRAKDFSEEKLKDYTKKFFENVINEYKILVDTNFPTLKEHFPFYKKFPLYVIAHLEISERTNEINGIMYAFLKNSKDENEVEIRGIHDEPIEITRPKNEAGFRIKTKNGLLHTFSYSNAVNDFLFTTYNDTSPFRECPVTAMVYSLVKEDLKTLYGEKYNMPFW